MKKEQSKKPKRVEPKNWTSAAKIDKLCEILEKIRAKDTFEKVTVFSQPIPSSLIMKFTEFLDIIEPALKDKGFAVGHVRAMFFRADVSTTNP